jgi:zinc protease
MTVQIICAVLLILFANALTVAYAEVPTAEISTLPATAFRQTTESTPAVSIQAASIPSIPYEKYKLKNGLEVILSEDHRLPLVSLNIWYHVGSANELPGHSGLAHLFEHLMFEGSKNTGKQNFLQYLSAAGATSLGGFTSFDHTCYFETVPSNQIELALWLESDRLGSMIDVLDGEKLSIQKDVVRNERRENKDTLHNLMQEGEYHALFPKGHPYFADIIGSHVDIESINLNEVRNFSRHYYTPNNATIVIVGDINKEHAKQQIEKYFGSISPGPPIAKVEVQTPPIKIRKQVFITDRIRRSYILMGWLAPPIYAVGDPDALITALILGGGNTSRLYKALVIDKHLARSVTATVRRLPLASIFSVDVYPEHGVGHKQLEDAVNKVLKEFKQNGPMLDEINAAREARKLSMISRFEKFGGKTGISNVLNEYNYFTGDPGYSSHDMQRYDQVTTASSKDFAEKFLNSTQSVVVYGIPGKKQIEDLPRKTKEAEKSNDVKPERNIASTPFSSLTEIWRSSPPSPSQASAWQIATPTKFQLSNGLTVYIVERHNVPVVALQVVARGGTDINPIKKPGLSLVTVETSRRGTERRSAEQFANELAQSSVYLKTGSQEDNSWISTYSHISSLTKSFDLLSDAIIHPAFAPKEIAKTKKTLGILPEVGERVLKRQLFGPKQALGYDAEGTRKSLKCISRSDLINCWKNLFVPRNSALIIAGDVTVAQAKLLAEKYFGGWQDAVPPEKARQSVDLSKQSIVMVDMKESPQTSVTVGSIGVSRDSPDYLAANVLNDIIGGLSSSRLNANLRGKHGYTYDASSQFNCYRQSGIFSVSSQVRADAMALAVSEIMSEIEKIHNGPISNEEFMDAKNNWLLSLPTKFETTQEATSSASSLFVYDRPTERYSTLRSQIDAITLAEVQSAAKKYLDPKKMIIVLVGDQKKIEPELKKLNYGPILETDWMGNPVHPLWLQNL